MQPNSPAFSLNAFDWHKALRVISVGSAGAIVTSVIPMLTGFSYQFGGHDFTALAIVFFAGVSDLLSSWIKSNQTLGGMSSVVKTLPESITDAAIALAALAVVALVPIMVLQLAAILAFLFFSGKALVENRPFA